MERILVQSLNCQYLNDLTEDSGLITFRQGETPLYITESINLRHTLQALSAAGEDDIVIRDLYTRAETVELMPTATAMEALIKRKLALEKQEPEFNPRILPWKEYVYLAINPVEFPFVKITEYTDEEWYYIGPFRSRFFLLDLTGLVQKLLKLPACDARINPCEKVDDGRCRGWCISIPATAGSALDPAEGQSLVQKLDALLKEAFVHPDNGLLELLQQEKDKYENDLQFAKAELLKDDIRLLELYKQWLIFFYKIKNFNLVTDKFSIKSGQLIRFVVDGKEHTSPFINVPYRPNELLALNKNLLDEARILYREYI